MLSLRCPRCHRPALLAGADLVPLIESDTPLGVRCHCGAEVKYHFQLHIEVSDGRGQAFVTDSPRTIPTEFTFRGARIHLEPLSGSSYDHRLLGRFRRWMEQSLALLLGSDFRHDPPAPPAEPVEDPHVLARRLGEKMRKALQTTKFTPPLPAPPVASLTDKALQAVAVPWSFWHDEQEKVVPDEPCSPCCVTEGEIKMSIVGDPDNFEPSFGVQPPVSADPAPPAETWRDRPSLL